MELKDKGRIFGLSLMATATLFVFMLIFLASFSPVVFSAENDTFTANVTVQNAAPSVDMLWFNDSTRADKNISLTAASNLNVIMCNATITDQNGWQDVSSVNATFWHQTSTATADDDKNAHYTNTSCALTGGTGSTVTALCTAFFEHEALNGSWNCTITAKDNGGSTGTNTSYNMVDQLIALSVNESAIHFGSMTNGQSSAAAVSTNVTNEGNVQIDVKVAGSGPMVCSGLGQIGVGNISYNLTTGAYTTMDSNKLSTDLSTALQMNLVPEGTGVYGEDENATNMTHWTITIPATGVRGECNNTITIAAVLG